MKRNRRRDACTLKPEMAEQILSNVFAASGREANNVPLEALVSYSNYRRERYALQRSVIILVLVLFLLLPLLFLAAGVEITPLMAEDKNPVYGVSVKTRIPIRQIQAELGGRSVPVYEEESGAYIIAPRENGEMAVSVTLVNRQRTQANALVEAVDMEIPRLVSTAFDSAHVKLYVEDAASGVDYEGIRVEAPSGDVSAPAGYEAESGCILLAYPQEVLSVRIPDRRGNVLTIELKPQK